jgi:hypothetical protein
MAENPQAHTRLRPIIHAYLLELAKNGAYGKNKAGVMRRFIENGIVAALESGLLEKKHVADFGETVEDGEDAGDD